MGIMQLDRFIFRKDKIVNRIILSCYNNYNIEIEIKSHGNIIYAF